MVLAATGTDDMNTQVCMKMEVRCGLLHDSAESDQPAHYCLTRQGGRNNKTPHHSRVSPQSATAEHIKLERTLGLDAVAHLLHVVV